MFQKKCSSCAKVLEQSFSFCPYCGLSLKVAREQEQFGLLGRDDSVAFSMNTPPLPAGMEKIMQSLIKQLEKQMGQPKTLKGGVMPKGFHIKISTGKPMMVKQPSSQPVVQSAVTVSSEDFSGRNELPKIKASSKMKRLADKIIYEIHAPGVKHKNDVVLTPLSGGLEIRAYSNRHCYVKTIPFDVEVLAYSVKGDHVIVEIKG